MLTKRLNVIYLLLVACIFIFGLILRVLIFDKVGGDYLTYKEAVREFGAGKNPYRETVISFKLINVEHGYAYFPTLLYIQYVIWLFSNILDLNISTVYLWKIPVLICDLLIFYLLIKKLGKPNDLLQAVLYTLISAFWLLNPYLIARYDYSLYDPIFLLFLYIAVETLDKNPIISGAFYSIAVSLKTVPLILLPLFFMKSTNKIKFLVSAIAVFILISSPFMKSFYDFYLFLMGSFFIHSTRELQGRPFLSFISYYFQNFGITFGQSTHIKLYSVLALATATLIPFALFLAKKLKSKYTWAFLSFFLYLVFTPILSRTHILWIIPWLLLVYIEAIKSSSNTKIYIKYGTTLVLVWILMFVYLYKWDKGIEVSENNKQVLIIKDSSAEWEFSRILRHRFYEIRGKVFNR